MSTSTAPERRAGTRRPTSAPVPPSRSDEWISAAFDGSIRPLTCTTTMRPSPSRSALPATARDRARRARGAGPSRHQAVERAPHRVESVGSHRPLVAWSDGGGGVLLHLPRRHRRRQGRRREDDRNGRAGGHRRARPVGPCSSSRSRASRGSRRCSARRPSATTSSTSTRHPGPLPHSRRRARRLPRSPTA